MEEDAAVSHSHQHTADHDSIDIAGQQNTRTAACRIRQRHAVGEEEDEALQGAV